MRAFTEQDIVVVAAKSSPEFVRTVLGLYARGQLFAIQRDDTVDDPRFAGAQRTALPPAEPGWVKESFTPIRSDEPAQIVFSSGTEGLPKAIVLSHRNLADVVDRLNALMGITSEIREYIGVPVTYSFGLGRARAVATAGGAAYIPGSFDPGEIRRMLEAGEINAISAVPSLWRVVLSTPEVMAPVGDLVRWIEIGSQFMSAEEKMAMRRLFPKARIVQHYGLTEASRSTFLDISSAREEHLGSVGPVDGSVEIRINEDGAICLRGDHVALGILAPDGQLDPLTDPDGWLVTKDKGAIRDGHLHFLGRLDDQINISGIKIAAEAIERDVAAAVTGVEERFAVTGVADSLRGEALLLVVEEDIAHKLPLLEAAARLALDTRSISGGGMLHTRSVPALPRTGTNKIRRAALREGWTSVPSNQSAAASADLNSDEQAVASVWQKVMSVPFVTPDQCFYDLGGDSLSSIHVSLSMEGAGFNRESVRATLEGLSLAEVATMAAAKGDNRATEARLAPLPDQTVRQWALSLTRAVMVISLLLSHWGPGLFSRLSVPIWLEDMLGVIYRMGTPGFSTVFGIGVGMYMLPGYRARPEAVLKRARLSFLLVFAGLCAVGLLRITLMLRAGVTLNGTAISGAFYNVLAFYSLALGTLWLWLPPLSQLRRPVLGLLLIAPGLWLAWQLAETLMGQEQFTSLLEWVRLMSMANYSVFKVGMTVILGISIGYWVHLQTETDRAGAALRVAGIVGLAFCLFAMLEAYGPEGLLGRSGTAFSSVPNLLFYVAVAMALLGTFVWVLRRWNVLLRPLRLVFKLGIVLGSLSLPVYVAQEVVIPAKDLLLSIGLSPLLALALPLGAFCLGIGYAGQRLYRVYF